MLEGESGENVHPIISRVFMEAANEAIKNTSDVSTLLWLSLRVITLAYILVFQSSGFWQVRKNWYTLWKYIFEEVPSSSNETFSS